MGFAAASSVEAGGEGRWHGSIHPGWDIAGKANGGYLLAIASRASARRAGRPHPVTVTGHFLSPGRPGPVTIDTETVKAGAAFTTVRATMVAAGGPILAVLGSYADLETQHGPTLVNGTPPQLPHPEDCIAAEPTATFPPPLMAHVDLRLHPDDIPFTTDRERRARVRGWFRWPDAEPMDTLGLLVAADAFMPAIFNADLPFAWIPTLELTVHVRAVPPPGGWLRAAFSTRFVGGGLAEEDGELWDEEGRLVAQSRQLALVRQPAAGDRPPGIAGGGRPAPPPS